MTTPTGTISMSDVNVELGLSSTATISLNDTNVRLLAGVPSGTISMNDLRGKTIGASYIGIAHSTTPRMSVYPWSSSSGFGSKFANPATIPGVIPYGITTNNWRYSSTPATAICVYGSTSPNQVNMYAWSSSGIGTKYTNPASWPSTSGTTLNNGVSFSPDGQNVVFGLTNTPFICAYPFNTSTGFGTLYSNPATLPTGYTSLVTWSRNGTRVLTTGNQPGGSGKFTPTWGFSGGWGAIDVGPSTGATCLGFENHPTQDYVIIGRSVTTNSLRASSWTESGGWGSFITDPATNPGGSVRQCLWDRTGTVIGAGLGASPYVVAYGWSAGSFGSKYAAPSTIPTQSLPPSFSWAGNTGSCATVNATAPYVCAYAFTISGGFGSKFADPSTAIPGSGEAVVIFG